MSLNVHTYSNYLITPVSRFLWRPCVIYNKTFLKSPTTMSARHTCNPPWSQAKQLEVCVLELPAPRRRTRCHKSPAAWRQMRCNRPGPLHCSPWQTVVWRPWCFPPYRTPPAGYWDQTEWAEEETADMFEAFIPRNWNFQEVLHYVAWDQVLNQLFIPHLSCFLLAA